MSMLGQCHEDCPDEATEFSGHRSDCDVTMFASVKAEELVDETELGFHGNGDDLGGLPLTSSFEDKGSTGVVAVVPGSFDQEAPDVDIAGLGD